MHNQSLTITIISELKKISRRQKNAPEDIINNGVMPLSSFVIRDLPAYFFRKENVTPGNLLPGSVLLWLKNIKSKSLQTNNELLSKSTYDSTIALSLNKIAPDDVSVLCFEHERAPSVWLNTIRGTTLVLDKKGRIFPLKTDELTSRGYKMVSITAERLLSLRSNQANTIDQEKNTEIENLVRSTMLPALRRHKLSVQLENFVKNMVSPQNTPDLNKNSR